MKERITILIVKSFTEELNSEEQIFLDKWLEKEEHHTIYDSIYKRQEELLLEKQPYDVKKALKVIKQNRARSTSFNFRKIYRYAALFVLGIIGAYSYLNYGKVEVQKDTVENALVDETQIQLKLSNGEVVVLNQRESNSIQVDNGQELKVQEQGLLIYQPPKNKETVPVMNTLVIPYGKKFQLVLSDGTKIHLNAGSALTYPSFFIDNQPREVLLSGEGFFEVTSSEKMPFYVNTNGLDVKVTGTKFNIAYYKEETAMQTVLVEGNISLLKDNKTTLLEVKPSQLALWDNTTQQIQVKEVDVSLYTSWINGNLIFKNASFKSIVSKLERHFDIEIQVNHDLLLQQSFTAAFYETESLPEILNFFAKDTPFEYTLINENKLTINQ